MESCHKSVTPLYTRFGRLTISGRRDRCGASRDYRDHSGGKLAMFLKLFRSLMPKEENFLQYFSEHSQKIVSAAEELHSLMASGSDIAAHCHKIYTIEGEADLITRATLLAIHRTFITPFDRSDIHGLITAMDDTIDLVEETAQRIELYEITEFTDEMKDDFAFTWHVSMLI